MIKNSWGSEDQANVGYLYDSENYIRAKTLFVMLHREALPEDITRKLGL